MSKVEKEDMKKNTVIIAVLVLSMGSLIWCDLIPHYKNEKIVLKGVENFGQGNDWEGLFPNRFRDIIAAPDDSIFVINSRTHNIFKFNKQGKLLKIFGLKGRGPGDFFYPGAPSILDNKYLVVGEYSSNRRFSIWDFNGKCINVVKTKTSIFHLTALRDTRVAYYHYSQQAEKKNDYQTTISIIIKDISSGKEKTVKRISIPDRSTVQTKNGGSFDFENYFGEVYLSQTIDGNLAIGVSNQPKIIIVSPMGELIRSFDLKINPIPANNIYIKKFRDNLLAELDAIDETSMDSHKKFVHHLRKKTFKKFDFSTIFDKYLPLYKDILVDSEGNFLVFKFTECQKDCNPVFQVYSKEGKYICETVLDKGKYEFELSRKFKRLCFTSAGIFVIAMNRGDEDEVYRLIKSNYSPTP